MFLSAQSQQALLKGQATPVAPSQEFNLTIPLNNIDLPEKRKHSILDQLDPIGHFSSVYLVIQVLQTSWIFMKPTTSEHSQANSLLRSSSQHSTWQCLCALSRGTIQLYLTEKDRDWGVQVRIRTALVFLMWLSTSIHRWVSALIHFILYTVSGCGRVY